MLGDFKNIDFINKPITYTQAQINITTTLINSALKSKDIWAGCNLPDGVLKNDVDSLKKHIKSQLEIIQDGYCPYCGFKFTYRLGIRSKRMIHREHIAPKDKYKEFIFTEKNLVLACALCNSLDYKSNTDTISAYNASYALCDFNIIHPYHDKKSDHLQLDPYTGIYVIINNSNKAVFTIAMFGLNEPNQIEQRILHLTLEKYNVNNFESLINRLIQQNNKI